MHKENLEKLFFNAEFGMIPHLIKSEIENIKIKSNKEIKINKFVFIDDFLHPESHFYKKYLKDKSVTINEFIKNENIKENTIKFGIRGRMTKKGNFMLKINKNNKFKECEFLIKKDELEEFFLNHEITEEFEFIDNLEKLNNLCKENKKIKIIFLEKFLFQKKMLSFDNKFEFKDVSEYLNHLFINREINYFMKVTEHNLNTIINALK